MHLDYSTNVLFLGASLHNLSQISQTSSPHVKAVSSVGCDLLVTVKTILAAAASFDAGVMVPRAVQHGPR